MRRQGYSSSSLFRNEDQHPRRVFFGHVRKPSGSTAGGNSWEDGSTADLDGAKTVGGILHREKGKDTWNLFAQWTAIRQIQRVADRKARKLFEDWAEYHWEIFWCEWLIVRSIADIVEQLCEDFPEDLGVDGSQDAEEASPRHQVEQSERASNFELPRWKEECTAFMLYFQCRFTRIAGLLERAFGPMEVLRDDGLRQSAWFIGKRGCRGGPAGRDRVAGCEFSGLIEAAQVEHVLVPVELKRESCPRSQAVESFSFWMEGATEF